MQIETAERASLQQRFDDIATSVFPWAKRELVASREVIGVQIEDSNLWMRYRNGLDRLVAAYGILKAGVYDDNGDKPDAILKNAQYLLENTAVEAWVQAAELSLGKLQTQISSPMHTGDKKGALAALERGLKHQEEGRAFRSTSMRDAIKHFKDAARTAADASKGLTRVSPFVVAGLIISGIALLVTLAGLCFAVWKWVIFGR